MRLDGRARLTQCEPTPTGSKEPTVTSDSRNRWLALILLCMGSLMIVLDTSMAVAT